MDSREWAPSSRPSDTRPVPRVPNDWVSAGDHGIGCQISSRHCAVGCDCALPGFSSIAGPAFDLGPRSKEAHCGDCALRQISTDWKRIDDDVDDLVRHDQLLSITLNQYIERHQSPIAIAKSRNRWRRSWAPKHGRSLSPDEEEHGGENQKQTDIQTPTDHLVRTSSLSGIEAEECSMDI